MKQKMVVPTNPPSMSVLVDGHEVITLPHVPLDIRKQTHYIVYDVKRQCYVLSSNRPHWPSHDILVGSVEVLNGQTWVHAANIMSADTSIKEEIERGKQ